MILSWGLILAACIFAGQCEAQSYYLGRQYNPNPGPWQSRHDDPLVVDNVRYLNIHIYRNPGANTQQTVNTASRFGGAAPDGQPENQQPSIENKSDTGTQSDITFPESPQPAGIPSEGRDQRVPTNPSTLNHQQPHGVSSFSSESSSVNANHNPKNDVELVTAGTNNFATNVYRELSHRTRGNIAVCPFSVAIALAILQGGAEGNTLKEINDVVGLPQDKQSTRNAFKYLLPSLRSNERYDVNIANNIYYSERTPIEHSFDQLTKSNFQSGFEKINFGSSNRAANIINRWVEQQTRGKIREIVKATELDPQMSLLLVNALYFKGKWSVPFDPYDTLPSKFDTGIQNETVHMMKVTDRFKYHEDPQVKAKFLELPYGDGEATMTFVLPNNRRDGLSNLEKNLEYVLNKPLDNEEIVRVFIPKFSIESRIPFKDVLQTLGIRDLFSSNANLSEMSKYPVTVDNVLQKTFLNVTEKGTEASAATSVQVVPLSAGSPRNPKDKEFLADHPFLYILRNKANNVVLFMGRFAST